MDIPSCFAALPARANDGVSQPSDVFASTVHRPPSTLPTHYGFTILEVMLSLAVLAAGTVAIIEVLQRAHAGVADGESTLIATHLAQRRLEELHNVAYASLANETKASVSSPSGFGRFSREVAVTTPYTNLQQIVITVYWTAVGGETSVTLQTYRSNS